jgi:hypothetical protein
MIEILTMVGSILFSIFTGVATIAVPIIIKSGLKYFEEKTKIMVSEAAEMKLNRLGIEAINYAEEAAAIGIIKESDKLNTAINMIIKNNPFRIGYEDAKVKVLSSISADVYLGATGAKKKLTT